MCRWMVPGLHIYSFMTSMDIAGLSKEEALSLCSHIADAFAKWIGRSAHFDVVPLLLEAG